MEKTFEASLAELEKIVKQLEDGEMPLEQSLKLFEDGVKISRQCRDRLIKAERRIEVLMKDAEGNVAVQELDAENMRETRRQPAAKRIVFDSEGEDEAPF